ncbi:hypothetical protein ACGFSG_15490 [Streptomyces sp. NPDC048512]|uniref:hypothetical protein n=1 Tax=unclassified Streptomyces TaxID=2593676 RepID=UPI003722B600
MHVVAVHVVARAVDVYVAFVMTTDAINAVRAVKVVKVVHAIKVVKPAIDGVTLPVHAVGLVMVVAWPGSLATTVAMAVKPPIHVVTVVKFVHVISLF